MPREPVWEGLVVVGDVFGPRHEQGRKVRDGREGRKVRDGRGGKEEGRQGGV